MQNALRERALAEAAQAAAESLTVEELGRKALPPLARALDAPIQLFVRALPGMRPAALANTPPEMFDRFVEGGFHREFPHMDPGLLDRYRDGVLVASRVLPHREFQRTRFYNEFFRPFGAEYQVAALVAGEWWQPGMDIVSLTRSRGQRDFSSDDIRILERLLPSFRAAVSRTARLERLAGRGDVLERIAAQRPVIALDRAGSILWMSRLAEQVLGRLLHPALLHAARSSELPPSVSLHLERGSSVIAHLSIARRDSGEPFVVAELTGEPAQRTMAAAIAGRHGLTPAESRVLGLLAAGLSNLEIARRLGVAPSTIRIELTSIFRKLGVRTRLQAALLVSDH
jgi:DNA-binding CsgD family transcriptional regulator